MNSLNLKSGSKILAFIRIVNKHHSNRPLVPILHENTVRFVGYPGEIYFEIVNHTEFDLTIDILNTNNDKINKIDLLRPFQNNNNRM